MKINFFAIVALLSIFINANSVIALENNLKKAKWTVMVYIASDNAFDTTCKKSIEKMMKIGSNQDMHVLVFQDDSRKPTEIKYIKKNNFDVVKNFSEQDSADYKVIVNFFNYCNDNYPAEKYILIISGERGTSWPNIKSGKKYDYYSKILADDSSGTYAYIPEISESLKCISETLGRKLDVLGLDINSAQKIENCYELKEYVNYIVSSEYVEHSNGWPYEYILGRLAIVTNINSKDLSSLIVKKHKEYYSNPETFFNGNQERLPWPTTLSVLDCSKVSIISQKLDLICDELIKKYRDKKIDNIIMPRNFQINLIYPDDEHCDLIGFLLFLKMVYINKYKDDDKFIKLINDLISELKENSESLIIENSTTGRDTEKFHGVSIYLPEHSIAEKYKKLKFYKTKWADLLNTFLNKEKN